MSGSQNKNYFTKVLKNFQAKTPQQKLSVAFKVGFLMIVGSLLWSIGLSTMFEFQAKYLPTLTNAVLNSIKVVVGGCILYFTLVAVYKIYKRAVPWLDAEVVDNTKLRPAGKMMRVVTLMCFVVTTITTSIGLWYGTVNNDGSTESYLVFVALMVILPVILFAAWSWLLEIPKFRISKLSWIALLGTILIVMCLTFFASTTTSVMGVGGKKAVQSHLVNSLTKLDKHLEVKVRRFRTNERAFYDAAEYQAELWEILANNERKGGDYSGAGGAGPLYKYLLGLSSTYQEIAKGLEQGGLKDVNVKIEQLSKDINSLRDKLNTDEYAQIFAHQGKYLEQIKSLYARVNNIVKESTILSIAPTLKNFGAYNQFTDTSR